VRIEHIRYMDHWSDEDGWKDAADDGIDPLYCDSVGWVVCETDDVVRLCANFSDSGAIKDRCFGAMHILKAAILKRTVLHD
jgi:hypothetical protein